MPEADLVEGRTSRTSPTRSVVVTSAVNVVLGIPSVTAVVFVAVLVDNTILGPADYEFAANREAWTFFGVLGLVVLLVLFVAINVGLQWWLTGFRSYLWAVALVAFLLPTVAVYTVL